MMTFFFCCVGCDILGHARVKRDSLSDSGSSIMDLEEGILETPLSKKTNCTTRYNNNISNTNVFTVETDVWLENLQQCILLHRVINQRCNQQRIECCHDTVLIHNRSLVFRCWGQRPPTREIESPSVPPSTALSSFLSKSMFSRKLNLGPQSCSCASPKVRRHDINWIKRNHPQFTTIQIPTKYQRYCDVYYIYINIWKPQL